MLHFLKYLLIGVGNTLLTLVVVWVLDRLGVNVYLANGIGFVVGGVNSYFWNKGWNFKSGGSHRREAPRFALAFLLGYAANLITLDFCVQVWIFPSLVEEWFSAWPMLGLSAEFVSNVIANGVYVVLSFSLIKRMVFRQ